MSDILQIQDFLFNGLLSCDLFAPYNVVLEREFLASSEIEFAAIWQQPRAGQTVSGIGLYVEMPKLEIPKPNSLQRNLVVSIAVIEERNINMAAGVGTGTSSEELAEMALDFMYGWLLGLTSGLTPETAAVRPAPDLIQGEGLVVYRATVSLRREHHAIARCDSPTITQNNAGAFVLTNGANTPDALIYYTVAAASGSGSGSGSGTGVPPVMQFPGQANATALPYTAPITLTSGQYLNFAAWRADRLPSHITVKLIS